MHNLYTGGDDRRVAWCQVWNDVEIDSRHSDHDYAAGHRLLMLKSEVVKFLKQVNMDLIVRVAIHRYVERRYGSEEDKYKEEAGVFIFRNSASLNPWESERNLAAKLIAEFQGQDWSGTLESWMAARIAELMIREQRVKGVKAKEACRKECSELICRLKSSREELDPQSIWNSINRNLGVLVSAGDNKYWFRHPKESVTLEACCDLKALNRDGLLERLIALTTSNARFSFFSAPMICWSRMKRLNH